VSTEVIRVKVSRKALSRTLILLILSICIALNSLYIESPIVGLPLSIALFFVASDGVGEVFFRKETKFFKVAMGFATFFVLIALFGSALIISAQFGKFLSLVLVGVIGLVFSVLSMRVQGTHEKRSLDVEVREKLEGSVPAFLASGAFVVSIAVAFQALAKARTGEGVTTVWLTIPDYFLPVFFLCSLLLMFVLFFTNTNVGLKLGLIFVYSFLARSLFWVVWYPGRYGDPWQHLGISRFIDRTGMPYAYSWILQNFLIYDLIKSKAQYAPLILISRMFNVDIYWVHILFVPFLWSFLVPLFSYKIAEMLVKERVEQLPLIAALVASLIPSLVIWGTVSVPNSVGFVFFFFVVFLMFYWVRTGKRQIWGLSFLVTIATFFAHMLPAIFALAFFLLVTVSQKFSKTIEKIVFYLLLFPLFPLVLYLSDAQFSLGGLFALESYGSFVSEIVWVMTVFGLLGLVLSLRRRYVDRRNILLVFAFYVLVLLNYYLAMYGMSGLLFGASRILVIADLLLLPFAALGVFEVVNVLVAVFSSISRRVSFLEEKKFDFSPRSAGLTLICLILSAQASLTLYQVYPHQEITNIQPADYMMEAVYYINSTAPGPYVVLCDTQLANIATGLLGIDYSYAGGMSGLWGQPFFTFPTIQLYGEMVKNPSISIMQNALTSAYAYWAETAYFVLSVMAGASFERALEETSAILPVDAIFGDGKLYIFKYPLPLIQEPGPPVKVIFDDGVSTEYAETSLEYFYETEINSTLTLSGHTSYNITEYPLHWTFLDLDINNASIELDEANDVNKCIYVKGLEPQDVLTVKWRWNRNYPTAVWKEDSFKEGWRTHDLYSGTIVPTIISDGNILNISYSFTPGLYSYYYYIKPVNITIAGNQSIIVRWRSDGPVAVIAYYFEMGLGSGADVVPLGSESSEWTVTIISLPKNVRATYVMVGISNLKARNISGVKTLDVDYILISTLA
jgi:hypothetical protein